LSSSQEGNGAFLCRCPLGAFSVLRCSMGYQQLE
jgi:hypothetical protein